MDDQPNFVSSPFDAIHHVDGDREFWKARELFKLLGYSHYMSIPTCELRGICITLWANAVEKPLLQAACVRVSFLTRSL
jgi:hypothetical protein